MQPIIVHESVEPHNTVALPKALATVFKKGELISFESNNCVHMDVATEDATFVGLAWMGAGDDVTEVTVLQAGVVDIDLDAAATFDPGAGLKYNAGSSSVDYSLTADAGANTLMQVQKRYATAVSRVRAYFDVKATLAKLYGVDA